MARELRATVHVPDEDGVYQVFNPGDDVPEWAEKQITNPKAWASDDADDDGESKPARRTRAAAK